ncbi:MAG: hypothetical protein CSB24_00755 [Deltaproteobacteria bacterium]|nr:MAG: hypothetical protein CSB24_00755 [Deltaproteobacteria bacterium]
MIATGRLAKDRKDEAVAFMMSLPDKTDFAVDGKDTGKSAARWFKDFVLSLGKPEFAKELPDLDFSSEQKDSGQLTDLSRHV